MRTSTPLVAAMEPVRLGSCASGKQEGRSGECRCGAGFKGPVWP